MSRLLKFENVSKLKKLIDEDMFECVTALVQVSRL